MVLVLPISSTLSCPISQFLNALLACLLGNGSCIYFFNTCLLRDYSDTACVSLKVTFRGSCLEIRILVKFCLAFSVLSRAVNSEQYVASKLFPIGEGQHAHRAMLR